MEDSSGGRYGVLEERVHGIETQLGEISVEIRTLSRDINDRSRTPWANIISACGVTFTVISIFAWLALTPIHADIDRIVDQQKLNVAAIVPRGEHEEKWRSYEVRHTELQKNLLDGVSQLQRQIDDIRADYKATYGARDALLDLRNRIDHLEAELSSAKEKAAGFDHVFDHEREHK